MLTFLPLNFCFVFRSCVKQLFWRTVFFVILNNVQVLSLLPSGFGLCTVVFNFRSLYISLLTVVLDENFGKYFRFLGPRQFFELLEAPVGLTSCQGSKLRQFFRP